MSSSPLEKVRHFVQRYQPNLEPILFKSRCPHRKLLLRRLV
ncbi:hypothetical protein [uncultured Brevibacillus sp.]|nr:hypothetical protein [uncultured Brevibacillus sp.]